MTNPLIRKNNTKLKCPRKLSGRSASFARVNQKVLGAKTGAPVTFATAAGRGQHVAEMHYHHRKCRQPTQHVGEADFSHVRRQLQWCVTLHLEKTLIRVVTDLQAAAGLSFEQKQGASRNLAAANDAA